MRQLPIKDNSGVVPGQLGEPPAPYGTVSAGPARPPGAASGFAMASGFVMETSLPAGPCPHIHRGHERRLCRSMESDVVPGVGAAP